MLRMIGRAAAEAVCAERRFRCDERLVAAPARPYLLDMIKFLLFLLLFVVCWPLALVALFLWPVVWLITLPFRLLGVAVEAVFELLRAVLFLPARLLGARPR